VQKKRTIEEQASAKGERNPNSYGKTSRSGRSEVDPHTKRGGKQGYARGEAKKSFPKNFSRREGGGEDKQQNAC